MAHLPKSAGSFKSPSTPNRKGVKSSHFSIAAPSTTPAGEPPSYLTNKSTTPSGHPPRSSKIFGSSFNAANNTFAHRKSPAQRGRAFAVPESSPPPGEEDDERDAPGEAVDEGYGTQARHQDDGIPFLSSIMSKDSPRGLKRSRDGQIREQQDSGMAEIARSYARHSGPAALCISDDAVLHTENILSASDKAIQQQTLAERDEAVTTTAAYLTNVWRQSSNVKSRAPGIGPTTEDGFTRANYLASLLIQLYHPHTTPPNPPATIIAPQGAMAFPTETTAIPVPKALLDWLDVYHNPVQDDFDEVLMFGPSPSAHESFWDLIGGELVRGHFVRVIRLLKDAGFEHAFSAADDNKNGRAGYEGKQLDNVEEVVGRFARVLETCPAVRYDDWDVKGPQWSLFRQRLKHNLSDLEAFSQVPDGEVEDLRSQAAGNLFAKSANGSVFGSMASASIRAESRVPWTIYENIVALSGAMMGSSAILDFTQDWLETSIFSTVWWDGSSAPALDQSMVGHRSLRQSQAPGLGRREVDISPLTAYRKRLAESLTTVTAEIDEPSFKPDTLDPVQIGLVCVLEDSVDAAIALLQSLDQTITSAVVEVAALAGWLPQARPSSRGLLQQGFSSEDLMVLSHGPGSQRPSSFAAIDRDEVLTEYADLLASKDVFRSSEGSYQREGWELAVSVLGRLDNTNVAQAKITEILDRMQFDDESRVNRVLDLCSDMGLVQQARAIAEHYADSLAESDSNSFGAALIYYARAHATQKLSSTISLLISCCMLQSAAIPADSQLDDALAALLNGSRTDLVGLATVDLEAATLLSDQISGYATMRRFYDLRDKSAASAHSLTEKREAANALIALIESASDCIRGGLFDAQIQSVVSIDGLLVLLGECLPLLNEKHRIFSKQQIFTLMRVVEDFTTAPTRIRESAIDLFRACLNAYYGVASSSHLNKSLSASGLSGSSSWDMVLSSNMIQSQEVAQMQRGWDWRKGLDGLGGASVDGKQILVLLRMALAREVARGWSGQMGW